MKKIFLYTMNGCPHCKSMKELFKENSVDFIEKNINEHQEEYEKLIVEQTKNEYLPAFLFLEMKLNESNGKKSPHLKAVTPDDDFESAEEALELAKRFLE